MDMFDIAFERAKAEADYTETMSIADAFKEYKEFIERDFPKIIIAMINKNSKYLEDKDTEMTISFTQNYPNPKYADFNQMVINFFESYGIISEIEASFAKDKINNPRNSAFDDEDTSFTLHLRASLNKLKNAYYTELQALPVREQEISEMIQSSGYTK